MPDLTQTAWRTAAQAVLTDGAILDGGGDVSLADYIYLGKGPPVRQAGTADGEFSDARGCTRDSANCFFIADFLNRQIKKYDGGGNFLTSLAIGTDVHKIAADLDRDLIWVACFPLAQVRAYNLDLTGPVQSWSTAPYSSPLAIAVIPTTGNVLVSFYSTHGGQYKVVEFNADGTGATERYADASTNNRVNDIAVSDEYAWFAYETGAGKFLSSVERFNLATWASEGAMWPGASNLSVSGLWPTTLDNLQYIYPLYPSGVYYDRITNRLYSMYGSLWLSSAVLSAPENGQFDRIEIIRTGRLRELPETYGAAARDLAISEEKILTTQSYLHCAVIIDRRTGTATWTFPNFPGNSRAQNFFFAATGVHAKGGSNDPANVVFEWQNGAGAAWTAIPPDDTGLGNVLLVNPVSVRARMSVFAGVDPVYGTDTHGVIDKVPPTIDRVGIEYTEPETDTRIFIQNRIRMRVNRPSRLRMRTS